VRGFPAGTCCRKVDMQSNIGPIRSTEGMLDNSHIRTVLARRDGSAKVNATIASRAFAVLRIVATASSERTKVNDLFLILQ